MALSIQAGRPRTGKPHFTVTVRVKPYPSATKTFATLSEAREWGRLTEHELRKHTVRGEIRHDVPRLTVSELIAEFLSDPATQGLSYYGDLARLLSWWKEHRADERVVSFNVIKIRQDRDLIARSGGRNDGSREPATVNRFLSAMRSCWSWGRSAGLVPQDLNWPRRLMLTEPSGRVRCLSDEELERLLLAPARHSPVMHAAVVVSLGCGIRQGELLRLKWCNVDLDRLQLRIVKAKVTAQPGNGALDVTRIW